MKRKYTDEFTFYVLRIILLIWTILKYWIWHFDPMNHFEILAIWISLFFYHWVGFIYSIKIHFPLDFFFLIWDLLPAGSAGISVLGPFWRLYGLFWWYLAHVKEIKTSTKGNRSFRIYKWQGCRSSVDSIKCISLKTELSSGKCSNALESVWVKVLVLHMAAPVQILSHIWSSKHNQKWSFRTEPRISTEHCWVWSKNQKRKRYSLV